MNRRTGFLFTVLILSLVSLVSVLPATTVAQLPGQRINPNVVVMLDTGRGMNWGKVETNSENPPADERTSTSVSQCDQMNQQTNIAVGTTAWQMVLESTLGDVPAMNQHCFHEEAGLRPVVRIDTVKNVGPITTDAEKLLVMDRVSDLTSEYWQFSREPHFRLVNCDDPRLSGDGGRGDWNTDYNQCVGDLPDAGNGYEIVTVTGRRYWCEEFWPKDESGTGGDKNYFKLPDGREICLNYNPLARERSTNGILEQYRTLARFSLVTFDNLPSPTEEESASWTADDEHRAGWDYGRNVPWYITAYEQRVPGDTYLNVIPEGSATRYWNAGVRSPVPEAVGRLVPISEDVEGSNEDVRHVLNTVEPLHCSFDAAMFDDVGYYLYTEPEVRPAYNSGTDLYFDCRPKLAVFITDGIQTDALEFPQDYCDKLLYDNSPGAPPAPWETTLWGSNKTYNCPFNSTAQEVSQLHEIMQRLSSSSTCQPLYLAVIGVNMKDKDDSAGPDRCDGAPSWQGDAFTVGHCEPPAEDCITLKELAQDKCNGTAEASEEVFVTPRQYLNMLALEGWPETTSTYSITADGGQFVQPPWRRLLSDGSSYRWCSDDPDNCGGEYNDGMANGALFVDSADELSEVLSMIMESLSPETVSTRTEIVTALNPDATVEQTTDAAQFIFNSGYRTSDDGGPWRGYLYREGQQCTFNDDDVTAADTDSDRSGGTAASAGADFNDLMVDDLASLTRRLWVLDPEKKSVFANFEYDAAAFKEGLTDVLIDFSELHDDDLGILEGDSSGLSSYVQAVNTHLKGTDGPRADLPLGDIYNSTPAVLPPPNERVPYASYQLFRSNVKFLTDDQTGLDPNLASEPMQTRKPLLYVGTNDGILHSFNVMSGLSAYTDVRAEGWGFVPSKLLETIGGQFPINIDKTYTLDDKGTADLSDDEWVSSYTVDTSTVRETGFQHYFGVDAPPLAADVLLYKKVGADNVNEELYWRSIVLGGLGKGGIGYYALDVTLGPGHMPAYRWQLSDEHYAGNAPETPESASEPDEYVDARNAFTEMGMGLSKPALAYVFIEAPPPDGGGVAAEHQVAVAILPGGYKNDENGGIDASTGVYIVRVADGKLLRYLKTTNDGDITDPHEMLVSPLFTGDTIDDRKAKARVAQLIGQPVVPNSIKTGKVADEAFIGDDRGRLWRIDMSSKNPDDWRLSVFFDTLLAEHFPYEDCLNSSTYTGVSECCASKEDDVAEACTYNEKQANFVTSRTIDDWGIDKCTGASCRNKDFPFARIPMLAPPTIVQDDERNNILLFGTGQIDSMETLDHHRIFSVTVDPTITVAVDDGGTTDDYTDDSVSGSSMNKAVMPEVNWWLGEDEDGPLPNDYSTGLAQIYGEMFPTDPTAKVTHAVGSDIDGLTYFGLGEKLLGRIFVFNKVAYFTTFSPLGDGTTNDACGSGGSKIWGAHFTDIEDAASDLDLDSRSFDQLGITQSDGSVDYVDYKGYVGEVLTGLRVVRQASCGGREGFTLMVQRASPTALDPPPTSGNPAPPAIATTSIQLPAPAGGFTRVGIDSWSIVMGGSVQ